jgi:hypothetical protein
MRPFNVRVPSNGEHFFTRWEKCFASPDRFLSTKMAVVSLNTWTSLFLWLLPNVIAEVNCVRTTIIVIMLENYCCNSTKCILLVETANTKETATNTWEWDSKYTLSCHGNRPVVMLLLRMRDHTHDICHAHKFLVAREIRSSLLLIFHSSFYITLTSPLT